MLGASVNKILVLLTRNFILLIIISLVMAIPTGSYLMKEWLTEFEYQVPPGWDVFVLARVIILLIAMITISYESIKAPFVNPARGRSSE